MPTENAVRFRREDYAGFWRRILVDLIDGFVIVLLFAGMFVALWGRISNDAILLLLLLLYFAYLVLLKRTRFGTLGYALGRIRVLGLDAKRPGLFTLTLRAGFMLLGPINYLADITWLSGDPQRQALRDKFTQTVVIKKGAEPVAPAKLVYRYYDILGYSFLFRELEKEE